MDATGRIHDHRTVGHAVAEQFAAADREGQSLKIRTFRGQVGGLAFDIACRLVAQIIELNDQPADFVAQ